MIIIIGERLDEREGTRDKIARRTYFKGIITTNCLYNISNIRR